MNLDQKILLVNQMIRENPDYTIADYLDTVADIERIIPGTPIKRRIKPIPVIIQEQEFKAEPEERKVSAKIFVFKHEEKEKWERPAAEYSNTSPFGLAKRKSRVV